MTESVRRPTHVEGLVEGFRKGDLRALARLLTLLDDGQDVEPILAAAAAEPKRALKVGLTGSAGAGKSTLAAALVKQLRESARTVAVLACDPASPFTGGALLGDRVRIDYEPADRGVFVRSVSSRGASGGLSDSIGAMARLVEGFGFDIVIIETVGAGQDQLAVRELVDVLVLVVTPAAGDEIQWEKAGLMEAADVVVVNKADLPGADVAVAGLKGMLALARRTGGADEVPVLKVIATKRTGIEDLWKSIEARAQSGSVGRRLAAQKRLLAAVQRRVAAQFNALAGTGDAVDQVIRSYARGELDESDAAEQILQLLR